ncbi:uncharacterized protein LOC122007105 [Zingiber officinale]|uniref:uncharacterized protein LOC122007105 n=1 Tax=Zingiber officinale TaxID=94328 RepID=UPI001C4B2271|nr:uncharacterized protein LOC122007105 [Zingiber officinale]XP_042418812.1 uncharacterized protein LOC122007105 [Zingiber officinale]
MPQVETTSGQHHVDLRRAVQWSSTLEELETKDKVSLQGKEDEVLIMSSSIGGDSLSSPLASEEEEEEEESKGGEVKSQAKNGALRCLGSLEDSLPIKRGLSSFFSGKSKSFSSLSDMGNTSTNNLAKTENSFNKRRRIRMASKAKRASYTSFISLSRPPLPPPPSPPSLKDHILEEGDKEGI